MSKVNRAELMSMFMWYCHAMNKPAAISESDLKKVKSWVGENWEIPCKIVPYLTGSWHLDYTGCYGGWMIVEMNTPGGGIFHPFGSKRRSARELVEMMSFARETLRIKSLENKNGQE